MNHNSGEKNHFFLIGLGSEGYRSLVSHYTWLKLEGIPKNTEFHYLYPGNLPEKPALATPPDNWASILIHPSEFQTVLEAEQQEYWLKRLEIKKNELSRLEPERNRIWAHILLAANVDRIQQLLIDPFLKISQDSKVFAVFLGALGDPVVSGILLDLAFIVKEALNIRGFSTKPHISGVFRLPGSAETAVEFANTYAILKDLAHNQRAEQIEVFQPSLNSGEGHHIVRPLLDQIMLLPGLLPGQDSDGCDRDLSVWILLRSVLSTVQAEKLAVFSGRNEGSLESEGKFGTFGISSLGPLVNSNTEGLATNLLTLLESSVPGLGLADEAVECMGLFDWTFCSNAAITKESANLNEAFRPALKKIVEGILGKPLVCEDDLPKASVSLTRLDVINKLSCICERKGFRLGCIKDIEVYRAAYQSMLEKGNFPHIENSGAADILPIMHIQSEPMFILSERPIRNGKVVITSTPCERIAADFLAVPFSGGLSCPGIFSADIIEAAGLEVHRQIAQSLLGAQESVDLEGDLLRVSGGNTMANTILLIKQDFADNEDVLKRVKNQIEIIFSILPKTQPISLVMPLLALEIPEPKKISELADCMLEVVTTLLNSKAQELVVIISVCQPEAVAEFVHCITQEELTEKHEKIDKEHKVERTFPYPVAESYHHLTHARQWGKEVSSFADPLLGDTLAFLVSIALGEYYAKTEFAQPGNLGNLLVEKHLINEKMEYGHWVGILREIGKKLEGQPDLFLPEGMNQVYKDTLDDQSTLSRIVWRRNNWRHRNNQQGYDDLLIDFVDQLDYLSNLTLVYIESSIPDKGERPVYSCFNLTGCDPAFERVYLECELQLGSSVYLVNPDKNEVLDLYPMLQAKVRKRAKYNWLMLYTLWGFTGDLSSGKIVYGLRTLEPCMFSPCLERSQIEVNGYVDKKAKRDLNELLKGANTEKHLLRRQKTGYLRFLSPEEVHGLAVD